jgi:hypothetical protein
MTPRPLFCVIAFAAAFALPALAADRFRVDPDHTFVHFTVVHTGSCILACRRYTADLP